MRNETSGRLALYETIRAYIIIRPLLVNQVSLITSG